MARILIFLFSIICIYNNSFADEINNTTYIKNLESFLKFNFKFVDDIETFKTIDYWQTGEEFLINRKGDCEDYAVFVSGELNNKNIENHIVSIYGKGYGHTVVIFKLNNNWNAFNNDSFYNYNKKTIEEVVKKINPRYTWFAFTEIKNNKGKLLQIFLNNP